VSRQVGSEHVVVGLEASAQAGEVVDGAADAVEEDEGLAVAVPVPVQCGAHVVRDDRHAPSATPAGGRRHIGSSTGV
jgi:hypothetical protein